jgi:hypothetical protein
MLVVIAGGAILGAIGLAALYDCCARRSGNKVSVPTVEARHYLRAVNLVHRPRSQDRR